MIVPAVPTHNFRFNATLGSPRRIWYRVSIPKPNQRPEVTRRSQEKAGSLSVPEPVPEPEPHWESKTTKEPESLATGST
jgi:hypothetical protein